MRLIKLTIEGKDVELVCSSRDTRSGFAHDATLFVNGCQLSEGHCYYLNRTWESWTYQSVCLEACNNEILWYEDRLKTKFKYNNNLSRVAGKRKEELKAIIDNDPDIMFLKKLKEELRNGHY